MLKDHFFEHIKSEFTRNVLTIFTGSSIAQIVPFIVAPVLTRLYNPEDFGLLALFTSLTSIIAIIATLQYESAIMLPKDDNDAINIVTLCLFITLGITIFSFIGVSLFNKLITKLLGNDRLSFWLYFLPISVFLSGLFNTLTYWCSRKKQFKRIAIRSVSQSVTTAFVKLTMGATGTIQSGLIIGALVGQTTATSILSWLILKEDKSLLACISKVSVMKNARIYRNFPKFNAIQAFLDILKMSLIIFIINRLFGSEILGYYSLSYSMVSLPIRLIGSSVSQVFYQKAAFTFANNSDLFGLTYKIFIRLIIIALPGLIIAIFFGPKLFSWFFGSKWIEAGVYAQIIAPWLFFTFVASPLGSIPSILNKLKSFFLISLLGTIGLPIIAVIASIFNLTILSMLSLFSFFGSLFIILTVVWVFSIIKKTKTHGF